MIFPGEEREKDKNKLEEAWEQVNLKRVTREIKPMYAGDFADNPRVWTTGTISKKG